MDITRAILYGLLGGSTETRNMFTGQTTTPVITTLWDLAKNYIDNILSDVTPALSDGWHATAIEVQQLENGEWISKQISPYSKTGEVSTQQLPNANAIVFTAKALGKRLIGRKFFAGLGESQSDGNYLSSSTLTTLVNALTHYINTYNSIDFGVFTPGILDKNKVFHEFVSGTLNTLIGTMVRRKLGRGI